MSAFKVYTGMISKPIFELVACQVLIFRLNGSGFLQLIEAEVPAHSSATQGVLQRRVATKDTAGNQKF